MLEMNYKNYIKFVEDIIGADTIRYIAGQVRALGKFQISNSGQWEPFSHAGYTIITPPFTDDIENEGFYKKLIAIREELSRHMVSPKILAAPVSALHMTVARLVSGDVLESIRQDAYEETVFSALEQVFSKIAAPGYLQFVVKGISILPHGIVAAIVSPVTEYDYQCLQTFRNYIYDDKLLANLGIERKRVFKGHFTLFYIEGELSENDRRYIADLISYINNKFFNAPLQYTLARAEVRKFDNYLSFYRKNMWPVFEFDKINRKAQK